MKATYAKVKGRETETALCAFINQRHGTHVERRRLTGTKDQGDIAGIQGIVIECKSGGAIALSEWVRELFAEVANAKAEYGFLAIKLPGRGGRWVAVAPYVPGKGETIGTAWGWVDRLKAASIYAFKTPPPNNYIVRARWLEEELDELAEAGYLPERLP